MKPWQHGYELEYLKSLEQRFDEHNKYSLSPFSKYKKNNIAADLKDNKLVTTEQCSYVLTASKMKSNITMYQDVVIATKMPGDETFTNLVGDNEHKRALLGLNSPGNGMYLYLWSQDYTNEIALECGWKKIGCKITTFGEIYNIMYKGVPREFPKIDPVEHVCMKQLTHQFNVVPIQKEIELNSIEYENHYSNYNKEKSWSAISLYGYRHDGNFIGKPSELSKKWKEENPLWMNWELQTTNYTSKFPSVMELVHSLVRSFDTEYHRIRLMKLRKNEGELERHTDLVDDQSGLTRGKLARLHIPIITNDKVEFSIWDNNGDMRTVNMKTGNLWVLDTRHPHTVKNMGDTDRIHLVIDMVVNQRLYNEFIK